MLNICARLIGGRPRPSSFRVVQQLVAKNAGHSVFASFPAGKRSGRPSLYFLANSTPNSS